MTGKAERFVDVLPAFILSELAGVELFGRPFCTGGELLGKGRDTCALGALRSFASEDEKVRELQELGGEENLSRDFRIRIASEGEDVFLK